MTLKDPIDIFTGPLDFLKIKSFLEDKDINYGVVSSNIGLDVLTENQKHTGYVFNRYTGSDYSRYHNYGEVSR